MVFLVVTFALLVLQCSGLDLEHNCSFHNEILQKPIGWGYPKSGDIPLLNRKIVKGRRVSIVEHPYVVSIRRLMAHYLVGTLVGGNLVLTVAHPIYRVPILELGVVAGQNYNDRGSTIYTVVLIVFHEHFHHDTLRNDIALIRVHEQISYRLTVKPVRGIVRKNYKLDGTASGFVTGWGRCDLTGKEFCLPRSSNYFRDEFSDPTLRSIHIDLKEPTPICDMYHKYDVDIMSGMLCLGPARQEDHTCACLAVPGAPLVIEGRLLGIQSWGFGCGYHTDMPLIYTDMRVYYNWIMQTISQFSELNEHSFYQLFGATKMAITIQWFSATREYDVEHEHPDSEIQPWKIDKDLALVLGRLYDIRDYYGTKEYHEEKLRKYQVMRQTFEKQNSVSKGAQDWLDDSSSSDSESDDYDNDDYDALQNNPFFNLQTEGANSTNQTDRGSLNRASSDEEEYF